MLCATALCCLALDSSGSLIGLGFFLQLFVRRMSVAGIVLLVYWSGGLLFLVWGKLHWPAVGADLGVGGVSHVEMLIFV